jgi:hypothetical protein
MQVSEPSRKSTDPELKRAPRYRRHAAAQASCKTVQRGPHIDSLPKQPPMPVNAAPVTAKAAAHDD